METPATGRTRYSEETMTRVTVNNLNLFTNLALLKGLARQDVLDQYRPPMLKEEEDGSTVRINGLRVSKDTIRTGYRSALSTCQLLLKELMLGQDVQLDSSLVSDVFSCGDAAYGMTAGDKHDDYEALILDKILNSPDLRAKYIQVIQNGEIKWKPEAANNYLRTYNRFIKALLVVVHVGGGMPARATELEPYLRLNDAFRYRSLYAVGRRVFFLAGYNKTSAATGKDKPIARFMDEAASLLLQLDSLLIRPFVSLMARTHLSANSAAADNYHYHMWVEDGKVANAQDLRSWFANEFHQFSGVALKLSEYRHIAKYFGKLAGCNVALQSGMPEAMGEEEEDDDGTFNVMDMQHGHSSSVADRHYALTDKEHPALRDNRMGAFRDCSIRWHSFLLQPIRTTVARPVIEESVEMPISLTDPSDVHRAQVASSGPLEIPEHPDPISDLVPLPLRVDPEYALQSLMGSPVSVYRSPEQFTAAKLIMNTTRNMLVVLPTGCGKTQLVLVAAKNLGGKVMVVISPLLALKADFMARCRSAGLSVCGDSSQFSGQTVLVLTPEAALSHTSKDLLHRLSRNQQLGRIFIDEVHLFLTDGMYRDALTALPKLGFLDAPLILLTATCPVSMQKELLNGFFDHSCRPLVVRQPTNRPNIHYSVRTYSGDQQLVGLVRSAFTVMSNGSKIIIYCATIQDTNRIKIVLTGLGLSVSKYHSKLSAPEKNAFLAIWNSPGKSVMVATSAFGVGIDHPSVRLVVLVGSCYSLLDFAQMSGRAGRDGAPAQAMLLRCTASEINVEKQLKESSQGGFRLYRAFSHSSNICRRSFLSLFLDGMHADCRSLNSVLCDVCSGNVAYQPALPRPDEIPADTLHDLEGLDIEFEDPAELDIPKAEPAPKMPRMEPEPPTPVVIGSPAVASRVISQERSIAANIKEAMKKLSPYCPWCFAKEGKLVNHDAKDASGAKPRICAVLAAGCKKCGSLKHKYPACQTKVHQIERYCFKCCLPKRIGSEVVHEQVLTHCPGNQEHLKAFFYVTLEKLQYTEAQLKSFVEGGVMRYIKLFLEHCLKYRI